MARKTKQIQEHWCTDVRQSETNMSLLNKIFNYTMSQKKIDHFLGRLPKVDLIILEGGKMSVRTSVRPSTKSFFDFNEIWYIGRGR